MVLVGYLAAEPLISPVVGDAWAGVWMVVGGLGLALCSALGAALDVALGLALCFSLAVHPGVHVVDVVGQKG